MRPAVALAIIGFHEGRPASFGLVVAVARQFQRRLPTEHSDFANNINYHGAARNLSGFKTGLTNYSLPYAEPHGTC
jgi:hypothetical protein